MTSEWQVLVYNKRLLVEVLLNVQPKNKTKSTGSVSSSSSLSRAWNVNHSTWLLKGRDASWRGLFWKHPFVFFKIWWSEWIVSFYHVYSSNAFEIFLPYLTVMVYYVPRVLLYHDDVFIRTVLWHHKHPFYPFFSVLLFTRTSPPPSPLPPHYTSVYNLPW